MSIREIFKPLDGVVVLVIVFIALVWSQCNRPADTDSDGYFVRLVTSNSVDTLSLFTDTVIVMNHLIVEINNHSAGITQSNCHTKQCVHTGYINRPGQISACMPNGIWLEILGSFTQTDVISY